MSAVSRDKPGGLANLSLVAMLTCTPDPVSVVSGRWYPVATWPLIEYLQRLAALEERHVCNLVREP